MKLKPGVRILGLRPELMVAVVAAESIWSKKGVEAVITSGVDGTHSKGSLHYKGLALDFRVNTLPAGTWQEVRNELADALGGDFDVVLEKDHIHVEFDPKEPIGA